MNCRVAVVAKADQVRAFVVRLALIDMVNMQGGNCAGLLADLAFTARIIPARHAVSSIFPKNVLLATFLSLRITRSAKQFLAGLRLKFSFCGGNSVGFAKH